MRRDHDITTPIRCQCRRQVFGAQSGGGTMKAWDRSPGEYNGPRGPGKGPALPRDRFSARAPHACVAHGAGARSEPIPARSASEGIPGRIPSLALRAGRGGCCRSVDNASVRRSRTASRPRFDARPWSQTNPFRRSMLPPEHPYNGLVVPLVLRVRAIVMAIIEAEGLTKTYRVFQKRPAAPARPKAVRQPST